MTIKLDNLDGIPVHLAAELHGQTPVFRNHRFVEKLLAHRTLSRIAHDLDSLCLEEGVVGYHFTRAVRPQIATRGLIAANGDDRRREFLAEHGHRVSDLQRKRISQSWQSYSTSSQTEMRHGRVRFNFTLAGLTGGDADDLLAYYGGENINMPLTQDEEIANIVRTIGEPLIIQCALDARSLHAFC